MYILHIGSALQRSSASGTPRDETVKTARDVLQRSQKF
jgi:hypothetical protein